MHGQVMANYSDHLCIHHLFEEQVALGPEVSASNYKLEKSWLIPIANY